MFHVGKLECCSAPGYQRTVPGLVSSLLSLLLLPGAGAGSSEPPAAAGTDQSEWGEDGPWRMQDHLQSHSLPNGIMSFLTREVPGWLFPFLWLLYHTLSLIRREKMAQTINRIMEHHRVNHSIKDFIINFANMNFYFSHFNHCGGRL